MSTQRARRRLRRTALVLLTAVALPGVSYARALAYPGNASFAVRTVEWVRDHNGSNIIDAFENWKYSRHAPAPLGAPTREALPAATVGGGNPQGVPGVRLLTGPSIRGEGIWAPARPGPGPIPVHTTFFRPDPGHTSVLVGAALISRQAARLHLNPGTREPAADITPARNAQVPASDRALLVATFNGGFKTADARGGWYAAGRSVAPLLDGAASLVITDDGKSTVGQWGRDLSMTSKVVAVRQNLALIVDNAAPADGLTANAHRRWGSAQSQYQYTWRSGIGLTSSGDLVYLAGDNLRLAGLAQAMVRAGVQRGMQLDMHTPSVSFNIFSSAGVAGGCTTLLPTMTQPANRYLAPDQRDFFYVTAP